MEKFKEYIKKNKQYGLIGKYEGIVFLAKFSKQFTHLSEFESITDDKGIYKNFKENQIGLVDFKNVGITEAGDAIYSIKDLKSISLYKEDKPIGFRTLYNEDTETFWNSVVYLMTDKFIEEIEDE